MKKYKLNLIILVLFSLAAACSKDEDLPADPRLAFAGTYESKEHIASGGTEGDDLMVKTVPAGIHIPVKLAEGNESALEMDFKDLVVKVMEAYITESFSVDFEDPVVAVINGNSFQLEATEFLIEADGDVIATLNGKGTFDGDTLFLEYEFSMEAENTTIVFKSNGEVELQKDDSTGINTQ